MWKKNEIYDRRPPKERRHRGFSVRVVLRPPDGWRHAPSGPLFVMFKWTAGTKAAAALFIILRVLFLRDETPFRSGATPFVIAHTKIAIRTRPTDVTPTECVCRAEILRIQEAFNGEKLDFALDAKSYSISNLIYHQYLQHFLNKFVKKTGLAF